ncbi:MAG: hypothetical protein AB7V27_07175 [Candidatus Binatia bacterium]
MSITTSLVLCAWAWLAALCFLPTAPALARDTELSRVLQRVLAPAPLDPQPGFSASLLVPPGELYDPLFMAHHGHGALVPDAGGERGDRGGRLLSVSARGEVAVIVDADKLLPIFAVDVAPPGFGTFAGQIFGLAQVRAGVGGAVENHQIVRLDPAADYAMKSVCTLPTAGGVNQGISGWGADAQFGPPGSPFAERFFAITALNGVIHQMTADGRCTPFATIPPPYGQPLGFAFTLEGKSMLVTASGGIAGTPHAPGGGAVLRVSPIGIVDTDPVVSGLTFPSGIRVAPLGFGTFGGELFVADLGRVQSQVRLTEAEPDDGAIYRAGADGKLRLVAKGLRNPMGLRFIGGRLWISDIAGDFLGARRELPDGYIAQIWPKGN